MESTPMPSRGQPNAGRRPSHHGGRVDSARLPGRARNKAWATAAAGLLVLASVVVLETQGWAAGGTITTVAGTGVAGYSGDAGPATAAALHLPHGVAIARAGGVITTVAGSGMAGYSGNGGPATLARMTSPAGVDVDAAGNLYIADYGNSTVRKVSTAGLITTVAGTGASSGYSGDGGPATS